MASSTVSTVATQHMILTGDKDRFKELLHLRLTECGWREQVKLLCRQTVKERGTSNVTVDTLVREVTPKARSLVPDAVKKELLHKIKKQLLENENFSM